MGEGMSLERSRLSGLGPAICRALFFGLETLWGSTPSPIKVSKVFKRGGLSLDLGVREVAPFLVQPLFL